MKINIFDNNHVQIGTLFNIQDIEKDRSSDLVIFKSFGTIVFKLANGFYKII
jgi:hypothetical protein